jgi:hypothetical protein
MDMTGTTVGAQVADPGPGMQNLKRRSDMKTRTPTTKSLLQIAAAAAAAGFIGLGGLTGCLSDPSSPKGSTGSSDVTLEGRVRGDLALAKRASGSMGIEGATVTVMRIKTDGSLEAVSGTEVKTDAQGRFSIRAAADGARELVVVARTETKEWKGVVGAKAEKGKTVAVRPLDTESSVEADVLINMRGRANATEAVFADIASHIDAEMAVKASGKADVEDYLSTQLQTEAEVRSSALVTGSGKYALAQLAKADEARMDAEAKLEADLGAAFDAGAETAGSDASVSMEAKARSDFMQAESKAYADAGIKLAEVAKACDSSYRAMIESGDKAAVSADSKLVWLHKIALGHAAALEAAVEADVKASGGSTQIAIDAGATLMSGVNVSKNAAEIDSAFAGFRAAISAGLHGLVDSTLVGPVGPIHDGGFILDGQVEGAVSGSDVRIAKVNADGSLEILPGFSGKTDAQGGFTLSAGSDAGINIGAPDSDYVVIVTAKDSSKLMTVVDASLGAVSKPLQIGAETTVETQVYQQTVKQGVPGITLGQIKAQVDSQVAAAVGVKGDDSAMARLLSSLEISYQSEDKFLTEGGFNLSASGLASISSARSQAQARLEADLKAAAGSETSIRNAYDTYRQALLDGYAKAGLDASAFARSQQVYAQALAHFSLGLSAEAKLALIRSAHAGAARALRTASETSLKASGAGEVSLKTLSDAGLAFQASVESAVSAEAIASAYGTYHAAATASLKSVFLLQSSAIETLDAKIRAQDGARAQLMSKVQSGVDAAAVSKAHVDFAAQVETETEATFGGLGAPSAAQVKAMAGILILANMGG